MMKLNRGKYEMYEFDERENFLLSERHVESGESRRKRRKGG